MALTYKEVAEILKIIDASECDEVVLELEGTRLVVRRGASGAASQPVSTPQPSMTSSAAPAMVSPLDSTPPSSAPPASSVSSGAAEAEGTTVRSPMVGTFYRRPSPDEAAFVEQGTQVKPGDALCLIEVMKLYTTIEAMTAGTVSAILADDGSLVEFDQPLFVIKEN